MTRTAFRFAAVLALTSTTQLLAAGLAAQSPCLTKAEVHGLAAYVMPSAVAMVVDRCKAVLPAGSTMLTHGPQLISDLEGGRSAAYPMARTAFAKFADNGDASTAELMQSLPETSFRPIMDGILAQKFAASIKVTNCADIDRVFGTLTPLPAGNFVDFVTEAFLIAVRDDKQMSVCPT